MTKFIKNIFNNSEDFSLPIILLYLFKKKIILLFLFLFLSSLSISLTIKNRDDYSTVLNLNVYNDLLFDNEFILWKEEISILYNLFFLNHNKKIQEIFEYNKNLISQNKNNKIVNKLIDQLKLLQIDDRYTNSYLNIYANFDNFNKLLNHQNIFTLYNDLLIDEKLINISIQQSGLSDNHFFNNFHKKIKELLFLREDVVNGRYSKLKIIVPIDEIENYKKFLNTHISIIDEKILNYLNLSFSNLLNSSQNYYNNLYDYLLNSSPSLIELNSRVAFKKFIYNQNELIENLGNKTYLNSNNDLIFKNVTNLLIIPNKYSNYPFILMSLLLAFLISCLLLILYKYFYDILKNK